MAEIFEFKGWSVDKERVAYYALSDKTKFALVDDIVCEDSVNMLISELDMIQTNLSQTVDKTDVTLNLALNYFTACLFIKSGNASQNSGIINSESLEGMSVSYGGQNQRNGVKSPIPIDYCSMALDQINRFIVKSKLLTRNIQVAVKNHRARLFSGRYNKYTGRNRHGVP